MTTKINTLQMEGAPKLMSKTAFKKACDFHLYTGGGQRINVIYFDWKEPENCPDPTTAKRGWKYAIRAGRDFMSKKELLKYFYEWVIEGESLPYWVGYKYAPTDAERFKTPVSLNF